MGHQNFHMGHQNFHMGHKGCLHFGGGRGLATVHADEDRGREGV